MYGMEKGTGIKTQKDMRTILTIIGLNAICLSAYSQNLQTVTDLGNVTTREIVVKGGFQNRAFLLQNTSGINRWGMAQTANGDGLLFNSYGADGTFQNSPLLLEKGAATVNGELYVSGMAFELGLNSSAGLPRQPYIDFHYSNSDESEDFNVRLHNHADNVLSIFSPNNKPTLLRVVGTVLAQRVQVKQDVWADFVFDSNYKLPSLQEVEAYIVTNRHLPDVPSETEIRQNGVDLGEINKVLLQKIEELTLHLIRQEKELEKLKEKVKAMDADKQ